MTPRLPRGYVDHDRGRLRIVAVRLQLEEMIALLGGPERDRPADPGLPGRGGTRRVLLPGGRAVYLRKYLRGGFMRHLNHELYLTRPPRPLRELMATETARAAGCKVPIVSAICVEEVGPFYRGWIVTEAMQGMEPWFRAYREADGRERARLLGEAGRAIRAIHRAGVYHLDLNVGNLLVGADGRVGVVDFDRATLAVPDEPRRAARGRARFWRSMSKQGAIDATLVEEAGRRAFDEGYGR